MPNNPKSFNFRNPSINAYSFKQFQGPTTYQQINNETNQINSSNGMSSLL